MSFDKLKEAAKRAAEELGISEYELYYTSTEDTSVEVFKKEVSSFSSVLTGGISVRVKSDGKMGYASSELLSEDEIARLVFLAAENAKATEKEDTVGIFSGSESYPDAGRESFSLASAEKIKDIALRLSDECYKQDPRVTDGTMSAFSTMKKTVRLSNSSGLDLKCEYGVDAVMAQTVIADGAQRESAFAVKRFSDGVTLQEIAERVTTEAISKIGASLVPTGKYNVVISSKQMKALLSAFSSAFSAKAAQAGLSLLADKVGERVASEKITLTDDPMREEIGARIIFDAEGVATKRKTVIDRGILKTLLHNRETAKRAGVETTANASKASHSSPIGIKPYAFAIEAGERTLDELFELAGDGVYITELKGLHAGADAVTGDFSIESAGYLIENGKLGGAVRSFTVAGNFFDLLKNVQEISNEIAFDVTGGFTSFGSPDVLLKNMSIAGK